MCVQQTPAPSGEQEEEAEAGGARNAGWRVSCLRWLLLSRRGRQAGSGQAFLLFPWHYRVFHKHWLTSLAANDIFYSRTPFTALHAARPSYSELKLGDKFAKLIFMRVAQLWQLSLVPCFEEFNLKFNQAAEHDRKNCLNSQHHQILWWYHIFAFLKMNFNPCGKIWEMSSNHELALAYVTWSIARPLGVHQ